MEASPEELGMQQKWQQEDKETGAHVNANAPPTPAAAASGASAAETASANEIHSLNEEGGASSVEATRVLRLHGLPYSIKEETIRAFFSEFDLDEEDAILYFTEGLHRGTGFIRLQRAEDAPLAIKKLHRQHIDHSRYVELAFSSEEDRRMTKKQQEQSSKAHVLRLRGLPFTATEEDVREFIQHVKGVVRMDICRDVEGRSTGDAFVELATEEDVEQAKEIHNKVMGTRYIEVLSSTVYDRDAIIRAASLRTRRDRRGTRGTRGNEGQTMNGRGRGGTMPMMSQGFFDPIFSAAYMGYLPPVSFGNEQQVPHQHNRMSGHPPAPYPAGGGSQQLFPMFPGQPPLMAPRAPSAHVIRIRGVPYTSTEESIAEFFSGVKIPPQGVHMVYNEQNRPTGEAFIELEDEGDVVAALEKNGGAMGSRYIEVFQSSAAAMQRLGSPLTGMMGMMPYPMQGLGMIPQMFY